MRLVFFGLILGMVLLCSSSRAQLTDLSASSIHLHVGTSTIVKLFVNNPNDTVQNITGWLGGDYLSSRAKFSPEEGFSLTANQRNFTIMLNPKEEKTINLLVIAADPRDSSYTITLNSNSTIDSSVKDSETLKVYIDYIPTFPGLETWGIALLMASAGAAFWARNRK
jgi:hypothetical protein